MEKYELAKVMLRKLKPVFNNPDWLMALNLLKKIDKKSTMNVEMKKKYFIHLVDKLYKKI